MIIQKFTVGMLETNAFIVHDNEVAIIIDPGAEPQKFSHYLDEQNLTLKAILLTHGHADHIGAVGVIRQGFPNIEVMIHSLEAKFLTDPILNLASLMGNNLNVGEATRLLEHGDKLQFGDIKVEVRHVPGHTPGHVVFVLENDVIVGDTLFAGSIGRFDLPASDGVSLVRKIREELLSLDSSTIVHPGHGPISTIGEEEINNPFLAPDFPIERFI